MNASARPATTSEVLALRNRRRNERQAQIVHDSIHRRAGWTESFLLDLDGLGVGFGSVAIAGPWAGTRTLFELYVAPELRSCAFKLFEALLVTSRADAFELPSDEEVCLVMAHAYGKAIESEKIVFANQRTTHLVAPGSALKRITSELESRAAFEQQQGSSEWQLELAGAVAGRGGFAFHYNRPFADVYVEILEPFRRRGLGSYLVQELKRECRALGAVPCARCDTKNVLSRRTLQAAGFAPCAHILRGSLAP